jgi:hypothetical protein
MANKKITELTALTTPDNADLFAIVDISLPETKNITYADLKAAVISGLGSVYQPLNSKLTTFAALADAAGVLTSDGAGHYSWGSAGSGLSPTGSDVGATSQIQVFTNGIKTAAQDGVDIQPFGTSAGNTGELRFYELAANGTNYTGFKSADNNGSGNTIWTLPAADGLNGQALKTNASGVLSWGSVASPAGSTGDIQFNTAGDLNANGDGYFVWDNSDHFQLLLKNSSGISFPSYSFVDAPTMGMYYDSGNLGITAASGNMILTCAGLSMNGNAGFTGTGTYINFTIENGIITSAS